MTVISIQSQVAYGHVGNSAAVFPMQIRGIDVIAVPTTLLSNRPGYPTIRGRILDADLVADLLVGIEERGAIDSCQIVLSGYLGSPQIAGVVIEFVTRAKANNPKLIYCCDPVLGDSNPVYSYTRKSRRYFAILCARSQTLSPRTILSLNGYAERRRPRSMK